MKGKNTVLDIFVTMLCLAGIVFSLYLFQKDLFMSLRSLNNTPAGTVRVKYNTVQRRIQDRMVWDRLFNESPVYNGDLIRIARLSGATLKIDENQIELGENTLIRIQKDEGPLLIDFFSGGINITSSKESGPVFLSIGDRIIEASPGSVFSASSGDEGLVLRVTEGSAQIKHDGQVITANAGAVFAEDAQGNRVIEPFVSMIHPIPNARLFKSEEKPLQVEFIWNRINMQYQDKLRLEVAGDRNFTNIIQSVSNLDTKVTVPLFSGLMHWRLSMEDGKVLTTGRLTVSDIPSPVALSPQSGRSFNMISENPEIQLRWIEIPDAIYYQLQISPVQDFKIFEINADVHGTSYITSNLNAGTWFWRVQPVFPNIEVENFSQVSYFNIQQNSELQALILNMPSMESTFILGEDRGSLFFSWDNEREANEFNFLISYDRNLNNPVITKIIKNNYYIYDNIENTLVPGRYYWGVSYKDSQGKTSPMSQIRSFLTTRNEIIQKLIYPPDRYDFDAEQLPNLSFSWETNQSLDKRFQVSSSPDFSRLEIDKPVNENSLSGIELSEGEWYWRITAKTDAQSVSVPTLARRFSMTDNKAREQAERNRVAALEQEQREREREQAMREQAEQDRLAQRERDQAAERERAVQLAREQLAREQAAQRDRLAREQAIRNQEERERLAREQAERDRLAREQAARDQAERDRLAREQAAREQAERDRLAREQAAREQADRNRLLREREQTASVEITREQIPERIVPNEAVQVTRNQTDSEVLRLFLLAPDSGTVIPGLTALRNPIVFRWDTTEEIAVSRFILSRNSNPSARPLIVEMNPERTITISRMGAGLWYWTVEARTVDGRLVIPAEPRQLRVLSVPLLPAPDNRLPANNEYINTQYLRLDRSIIFRWSEVEGANSYILTIYREAAPGRRQIFQTSPIKELNYSFRELSLLENSGNFFWQVEALFYNDEGKIEQRGQSEENIFILDVPRPGQIRVRDSGVLYGME